MLRRVLGVLFALGVAASDVAAAPASDAHGVVEAATSRWDASGALIVTDVVVRTPDGQRVTVTEHGGSVDGLGMWVSHRDPTLRPGDEVALRTDRSGPRARRIATRSAAAPGTPSAGTAQYGVQRTATSGRALYHPTGCLSFLYDARGTAQVDGDREWAAFETAFEAWEAAVAPGACGGVRFDRTISAETPDGRDGINTIHFRDDSWCRPASISEPATCHSPEAVAVTRVLYVDDPQSPRDGEILEVDIDVNAIDFVLGLDGSAAKIDLVSAAAHEIGHALGLDHNCGLEGAIWPTDADGAEVPSCESIDAAGAAATMYFQVQPGTTTMRTPEPRDAAGLCTVVAATCEADVAGGGCTATRSPRSPAPFAAMLAGLALAIALRRRRARA